METILVAYYATVFKFPIRSDNGPFEGKWCLVSGVYMPVQDRPETQGLIHGLRKVERKGGVTIASHRQRGLKVERGEMQRQSHRQRRGSWLRGVRVLFLVSLIHISEYISDSNSCWSIFTPTDLSIVVPADNYPHITGTLQRCTSSGDSSQVDSHPSALFHSSWGCRQLGLL